MHFLDLLSLVCPSGQHVAWKSGVLIAAACLHKAVYANHQNSALSAVWKNVVAGTQFRIRNNFSDISSEVNISKLTNSSGHKLTETSFTPKSGYDDLEVCPQSPPRGC